MDYPFYVRHLVDIPSALMQPIIEFSASSTLWKLHPFFKKGSVVLETLDRKQHHELDIHVSRIVDHLHEFLPREMYTGYSLNRLPAGGAIGEHSDINTFGSTEPMKYVLHHKIHIPIISNPEVISLHRRTKKTDFDSNVMEVGKSYLYNDYVWHAGHNHGPEPRVHMLIKYFDPEWTARLNVCKKLGIDEYSTYE